MGAAFLFVLTLWIAADCLSVHLLIYSELSKQGRLRMAKRARIEVSLRALTQRINRKLAEDDQVLRAPRGSRPHKADDDYYIVNTKINAVHARGINIETLGRKLGVLKEWEALTH